MRTQRPEFLGDEVIFLGDEGKSTWWKVMLKRTFLDPRKREKEDYYLFHSLKVPSIVLVLTKENQVVAIRIFCQAANEFILQVPGGVPRAGESFEDAAKREILEETGYRVGRLVNLGKGWFEPFNTTTPFMAFLALECEKVGDTKEDETEYLQVETYPWQKWWEMCLDGTIEDAKSVLVTARSARIQTAWA